MKRLPKLTREGAGFVCAFEGFVATCYDDGGRPGVGNCTIGYGHLVHYGPTTEADRRRWGSLSRAQGQRLFIEDARPALYAIERTIRVALTPAQIAALVSFTYNCGAGALEGAVAAAVNAKPHRWSRFALRLWHARVAAALAPWDHVGGTVNPGLHRRRQAEAVAFATGALTHAGGNPYANA